MRYRDHQTGKFVSHATWKRSKARGGTRYRRERPEPKPKKKRREITPAPPKKKMWRVTVAAPYNVRGKKRGSYTNAAFMVRAWFATKLEAQHDLAGLKRKTLRGREKAVKRNRKAWSRDVKPNTEIVAVDFDKRFLDTTEEKNEVP